jgi:hypothetical protein
MRKRSAALSFSPRRRLRAWRCRNDCSDSWLRASSVASARSSSPRLFWRAGASLPPLAVVGRHVDGAVAFQSGSRSAISAAGPSVSAAEAVFGGGGRCAGAGCGRKLAFAGLARFIARDRRVDGVEPELLARRFFGGALEERVLVEHLLHLLAQFERGELQQPDRLLQLGREREMLRDAKGQPLLHEETAPPQAARCAPCHSPASSGPAASGGHARPPFAKERRPDDGHVHP